MLDGSGGVSEWLEGTEAGSDEYRWTMGSPNISNDSILREDQIGWSMLANFRGPAGGIRLVSAVPEPGAGVLLLASLGASMFRTRERHYHAAPDLKSRNRGTIPTE
jgi:hypothetical protein